MTRLKFPALVPKQTRGAKVAVFVSTAAQVAQIARIERLARSSDGVATGFQRPQVAGHIKEISAYLREEDAILPNAIVLGFVNGATVKRVAGGQHELSIDIGHGAPGLIVDGQQRFTALTESGRGDFQIIVSAFICDSVEELRSQFILINNTKPLPRGLIDELLPTTRHLPHRYNSRTESAELVGILNHRRGSSLRGLVRRQTCPGGVIVDTNLQKLLKYSLSDGVLRLYRNEPELLHTRGVDLISEFFHAVQHVFRDAWEGHTPKTSRLLHGAGIISMGFVMEHIHAVTGATRREQFIEPLTALRGITAWTEGEWVLGPERRRWNSIQNVSSDWKILSFYLVRQVSKFLEGPRSAVPHVRR